MSKYFKIFQNKSEYDSFVASDEFIRPNVSLIKDDNVVKYKKKKSTAPMVTLHYEPSNENLLAFSSGAQNIKNLKVDGINIPFSPINTSSEEIVCLASEFTNIDLNNQTATFPGSYTVSAVPSSWVIKPKDPSRIITDFQYIVLFGDMGGQQMFSPTPLAYLIGYYFDYDVVNNQLVVLDDFLGEFGSLIAQGTSIGFCLCDVNMETQELFVVDTINTCSVSTGGLPMPYYFETAKNHTIEMELIDSAFGTSAMFEGTTLVAAEINDYVTAINSRAFGLADMLKSVTIGSKVASIGDYAFYNCYELTAITIPDSVTSIGDRAFYNCSGLTEVTIGSGVTEIGNDAFYSCKGLTGELIIPDSVTTIGENAFYSCSGLTSVTIGSGVTSIGDYAFYKCSGMTEVTIGSGVTSIGNSAFYGCSGLTEITCHAVVAPSIQSYTFQNVKSFGVLNYPEGSDYSSWMSTSNYYLGYYNWFIQEIGVDLPEVTLDGYDLAVLVQPITTSASTKVFGSSSSLSAVTEMSVDGVVLDTPAIGYTFSTAYDWHVVRYKFTDGVIPSSALSNCIRVREAVIGDSVTSVGSSAFTYCSGLTEVTIGSGVTSIGSRMFYYCSNLKAITIPDSVTSIASDAFSYCSSLPVIDNIQYADKWAITVTDKNQLTYELKNDTRYLCNKLFSGCTSMTGITIPDSVTSIGTQAFESCSGLTSIVIPDYVTSIGGNAFYGCSGLTEVTIGSGVTSIDSYVFWGCSGLTGITIPDGVTSIGYQAFAGCSGLTDLTIGSGVTSIGNYAFDGCKGLTGITIPDSVTSIGSYAFEDCSGLTSVTIGSGVTEIGDYAFRYCTSLPVENNLRYADTYLVEAVDKTQTTYSIKDSTKWIGNKAFYYCMSLTSITIPDSVTFIGPTAFYGCSGLTSIIIPDSVTSIEYGAFYLCSGLTEVTIGSGATSIGNSAFRACSGLTCITIPDSVTTIGISAFTNCSGLTDLTIGSGVTSIGNYAFRYCSGLTEITCHALVAPTIQSNTFQGVKSFGVLNYPEGSDYSSWMSTDSYYLGCYYWNQEQPVVTVKYNVTSTTENTKLCYNTTGFTDIVIDGVPMVPMSTGYTFTTTGEHTVEFTLNSLSIGGSVFYGCKGLTSITIPDSVTSIGGYAFSNCSGLTSVTIGSGVTIIGNYAFAYGSRLREITCHAVVAPSIQSATFQDVKSNGVLYVPSGASGYDTWMGTGDYYLGKYNWTIQEMS